LGETISVDVTGDGAKDINVSYEKYSLGSAQIGIRMAKLINTGDNVQVDVEDVDGDKSVVSRFFGDGEFREKVLLVVSVVLLILIILFFILILSVFRRSR
jgi:type II secretory pathway component PulM